MLKDELVSMLEDVQETVDDPDLSDSDKLDQIDEILNPEEDEGGGEEE